ncbi:MAG: hypothetical protein RL320_1025, partial [Pseudomonadota bacterium]
AWGELGVLHRARRLSLIELHATDAKEWKNGHGQNQNAHAANPLKQASPGQNRFWRRIQTGQNRGSSSCQCRHRLKKSLPTPKALQRKCNRQRSKPHQSTPTQQRITRRNPSRGKSSAECPRVIQTPTNPTEQEIKPPWTKAQTAPSSAQKPTAIGTRNVSEKSKTSLLRTLSNATAESRLD